jgi:hypothetical protein
MKIIHQTATEIIFRDKRFPLVFVIWCLLFGGIPLFMVLSFLGSAANVDFSCERIEPQLVNCELITTPLLRIWPATTQKKYSAITAAEYKVDETEDSEGDILNDHYIVLTTRQGKVSILQGSIYINGVRGNPKQAQIIAKSLNQFLDSQQQSISFKQDADLEGGVLFMLGFLSIFIFIAAFTFHSQVKIVTLKIDKNDHKIKRSSLSIFGLWKKSYNLQEVQNVEVKEENFTINDHPCFTPIIKMRSGKECRIGEWVTQEPEAIARANIVRRFLNLDVDSPTS